MKINQIAEKNFELKFILNVTLRNLIIVSSIFKNL
jgi:hypothetical protein